MSSPTYYQQIMNQSEPMLTSNKKQSPLVQAIPKVMQIESARLTSIEDLTDLSLGKKQSLNLSEGKLNDDHNLQKSGTNMILEEEDGHARTRRGFRKNEQKLSDHKAKIIYDTTENAEDKHDSEIKQLNFRKQEDKQSDVYLKIIEYSKKIEWDKDTAIHKMNPFQYFTPSCFWFLVCSEYFSFNMGCKKFTNDAISEIMNKINKIRYPIPTRLGKMIHFHHNEVNLLEMETLKLKNASIPIVEILNDCIPACSLASQYDSFQKIPQITQISDDNLFRSTTRVMVYNYVKKNCIGYIQPLLEQCVIELNTKSLKNSAHNSLDQEKHTSQKQLSKMDIEGDLPKVSENQIQMQVEKQKQNSSQPIKLQNLLVIQEQKGQKQYSEQDILLDTILHLPLDKIISILQSQISQVKLPKIEDYLIPIPSDPFELISPPHHQQKKFLQYLKQQKLKHNHLNENVQQPKINTLQQNVAQDVKCQVCTDGDYTDDNLIVFCSTCNISVHQRCVGLAKVPTENWICEVCHAFGPKGRFLRCPLCTVRGGALKRTTISTDTMLFKDTNPSYHQFIRNCPHSKIKQEYPIPCKEQHAENKLFYDYYDPMPSTIQEPSCTFVWIHYTCSIWVPQCYFQQRGGFINIKGIDNIDKKRYKLVCEVCHTTKSGAAIKCAEPECSSHYHAECARIAGIYMQQRYVESLKYFLYCKSHQPLRLTRLKESKAKKSKDQIIKFCRAIEKYVDTYKIASVPFKLLKQNKKVKPTKKQHKIKDAKQHKENDNVDFMEKLKDFLISGLKLVVSLKKVGEHAFKVIDIQEPVKRALKSNIHKNDEVWEYFTYKNLSSSQMYKKYKKVMKQMVEIKDKFCKDIKNQSKNSKKKNKMRARQCEEAHAQEDPDQLYCVCKQKYVVGQLMMQCQICDEWYHFKCIGFIGTEDDAGKVLYNCPQCQQFQDKAQIQERKEKFKNYYIPNFQIKFNNQKQDLLKGMSEQSQQQQMELSDSESSNQEDQQQNLQNNIQQEIQAQQKTQENISLLKSPELKNPKAQNIQEESPKPNVTPTQIQVYEKENSENLQNNFIKEGLKGQIQQ